MTDISKLRELLARVESAAGPDQELDKAISKTLLGESSLTQITSCITSAKTLCERVLLGWGWSLSERGAAVHSPSGGGYACWHKTPAICLCAAILRAKIAMLEKDAA